MKFADILGMALMHLRGNRLRSGITVIIIAFGIMALVGIITAIGAMNQKLMESFSTMGSNGFTLSQKERRLPTGRRRSVEVERRSSRKENAPSFNTPVTKEEAERFASAFQYPSTVSLAVFAGSNHRASAGSRTTNPGVLLVGSDENYAGLNGLVIAYGRNLAPQEVRSGLPVCLLGADVAEKLFPGQTEAALQQTVNVDQTNYRVVGIFGSRGSAFGFSRDNLVVAPYKNVQSRFGSSTYRVGVKTEGLEKVENAMGEAEGLFRAIRKLKPSDENNFAIDRSDSLAEKAMNSMRFITIAVTLIGLITLAGAAIGLMNILLVAVAERTREIGIMKALGGSARVLRHQLLVEAVLISAGGAAVGVLAGIAVGNVFAIFLHTDFIIPWNWLLYGIIICVVVGLLAGTYPAWKAGRLNPIDALRYE